MLSNRPSASTSDAAVRHDTRRRQPASHRLRMTAAVLATAVATLAGAQAASAATVDMGQVVIAAQLDQYRPDNATTPGTADDVKRIQRKLRAKGYAVTVDGNFGAETVAAYARWQRELGSSGLGANGIPGHASLRQLGFTLTNPVIAPGPRTAYSGEILNTRTIAMLKAAGRRLGCTIDVTKGSFTGPDSSSAGTHAGGGAVDISVARGGCGKPGRVVTALRTVGFAAWYRHTGDFADNKHIHAIAISDLDMSTETAFPGVFDAREQIVAFAQGKDGLSGAGSGPMTNGPLQTWERYKRTS